MLRYQKVIAAYFIVLGIMASIAIIPGGTLSMLILTGMVLPFFGVPGFLTAAAPTIFIYSTAAFALFLAATSPQRNYFAIGAVALVAIGIAVGPGLFTRWEVTQFADHASAKDLIRQPESRPRTIELIGNFGSGLYQYGEEFGDERATCSETCRRLLFDGEVEWVRMTFVTDSSSSRRPGRTYQADYRLERRESCPQLYVGGRNTDKAVRDRLVAGDCIIMDAATAAKPDARVSLLTLQFKQQYPIGSLARRLDTVAAVKELRIEQDDASGALAPVLVQTQTTARPIALPFYISAEMHMQGGYNGPVLGRTETAINPIDLTQILRSTFGFKLDPVAPPLSEDAKKIVERILSLPRNVEVFSAAQQQVIDEQLKLIHKRPVLVDADVALIRRVLADDRIDSAQIGITMQGGPAIF